MSARSTLYLCYFLSGLAALIYEISWSRILIRELGASLYAISAIAALFLAGLAIGALSVGRLTTEAPMDADMEKRCVRLYAGLEIVVGVWGACLPFVFSPLMHQLLPAGSEAAAAQQSYFLRMAIAACFIVPPAALMGATFPLLVLALRSAPTKAAEELYGLNTAGAACGAILSGFFLLPALGLTATSLIAAAVNWLSAIAAISVARSRQITAASEETLAAIPKSKPGDGSIVLPVVLLAAFLSGFLSLIYEIGYTRLFALILGSSTFSLSAVLALFLLGLAIGAVFVSRLPFASSQPALIAAAGCFMTAVLSLCGICLANEIPWLFLSISQGLTSVMSSNLVVASMLARMIVVMLMIFVPAILMGTTLPLLFIAGKLEPNIPSHRASVIYGLSTIGAILGSLLTGFVLIPGLSTVSASGIQSALLVACAGEAILSTILFVAWAKSFMSDPLAFSISSGMMIFMVAASIIDVGYFRPEWNQSIMSCGATFYGLSDVQRLNRSNFLANFKTPGTEVANEKLLFYREGLNSTVTILSNAIRNVTYLKTDGKTEVAVPADPGQPTTLSDVSTHVALGMLPILLSDRPVKDALVVGFGSGTSCGSVLSYKEVERVKIAELESSVFDGAKFFGPANGEPLRKEWIDAGRTLPIINDGRYVLLTEPAKYDAIVCQPSDPWVSGSSELFSTEFWELAKSKLQVDGVMSQWIQLYSVDSKMFSLLCRSFVSVFPNSLLFYEPGAGECILIGINNDKPITPERLKRLFSEAPAVDGATSVLTHTRSTYNAIFGLNNFKAAIWLDKQGLRRLGSEVDPQDKRINTDDNLLVEYAAAKSAFNDEQNIAENVAWLKKYALP